MGSWGWENFGNDAALDMVDEVLKVARTEIQSFCEPDSDSQVEDLDTIMACVAIHLVLHEHCNAVPPTAKLASAVRPDAADVLAPLGEGATIPQKWIDECAADLKDTANAGAAVVDR